MEVFVLNLLGSFGSLVFSEEVMKKCLPSETYLNLKHSIELSLPLEPEVASVVASAMKDWAVGKGATHYTHWFQPMTGVSAGKHDGFLDLKNGKPVVEFSGKCLIKGEPDASSFPNGGLRNTFEARGYTTWDFTSPAFIKGKTLYIPTAFCSYTGEALDTKTPLLRSMEVVSKHAVRVLRAFGDNDTKSVIPNVGAEQEYFLIDREDYEKRLDLKICGRSLFGANPVKGQEMEDHYCSRIRLKVSDYMNELDEDLLAFGICAKTKHNEAAPAQHEMAPSFESCNVAADHNQLIMETMRVVAKRKGLACLLHEKPFLGVNGSGKHNNWSLCKDNGANLFSIGHCKEENMLFLVFLCSVIRALDRYAGLLRLTAACAGNDIRLGGNEAPPAIMSVFLGEHLYNILKDISAGGEVFSEDLNDILITNANTLPNFLKDNSDRNRTSPFAFTGNKCEFRMLGASSSISFSTTVLNIAVAESLDCFAGVLEKERELKKAVVKIIKDTFNNNARVIFNGNNYSKNWQEEAEKRGLCIINDTVEAAKEYLKEENIMLFEKYKVLTRHECEARYEIMLDSYCQTVCIEAHTMLEMVGKEILPAIVRYVGELSSVLVNINRLRFGSETSSLVDSFNILVNNMNEIYKYKNLLDENLSDVGKFESLKKAEFVRNEMLKNMKSLRKYVDKSEQLIPKNLWKMPSITEILHRV